MDAVATRALKLVTLPRKLRIEWSRLYLVSPSPGVPIRGSGTGWWAGARIYLGPLRSCLSRHPAHHTLREPARRSGPESPHPQGRMDALYVGLDVAKDHRDVHLRPTGEARVAHDDAGVTVLTACLSSLSPILSTLEATGGYE